MFKGAVTAAVIILSSAVGAAQLTLPELARLRGPEPVSRSRTREFVPPSFDTIVANADLIVHGRAVASKTYLSDDQMHLFTDYVITPIRVLLAAVAKPQPAGPPPAIIVKQFGGETTIAGVRVSDQDDEMPPIQNGSEVLLVLTLDKSDNKAHRGYCGRVWGYRDTDQFPVEVRFWI